MARSDTPRLVVDLGSGTGLSSRYWSPYAKEVVGIEPSDSMRAEAVRIGGANLSYRSGFSHATGLPDGCADLVVCAQSLHWMEPAPTFAESARILRAGGVFAAYDYDWPPSTPSWEADMAYTRCMELARRLEREKGLVARLRQWDKEGHLDRMAGSGRFRFVRECLLSHKDQGGAERLVALFLSQGYAQSLLKLGLTEDELHIGDLRSAAICAFGDSRPTWIWSARVRIGVA
jgi:SAM-dependent methyltransferase